MMKERGSPDMGKEEDDLQPDLLNEDEVETSLKPPWFPGSILGALGIVPGELPETLRDELLLDPE